MAVRAVGTCRLDAGVLSVDPPVTVLDLRRRAVMAVRAVGACRLDVGVLSVDPPETVLDLRRGAVMTVRAIGPVGAVHDRVSAALGERDGETAFHLLDVLDVVACLDGLDGLLESGDIRKRRLDLGHIGFEFGDLALQLGVIILFGASGQEDKSQRNCR